MKKTLLLFAIAIILATNTQAQTWNSLGNGVEGLGSVAALTTYNGNLYAGGNFNIAGSNPASNIAMWNGTSWDSLKNGVRSGATGPIVCAMAVYNGSLIVGGNFDSAGGSQANCIAAWNGSTWSTLSSGLNSFGIIQAMIVYNSNLIVAGSFTDAGGNVANNIAAWNGTTWSALGSGIKFGTIYTLALYNGSLIAGGDFTNAGGNTASNIAAWNGTTWTTLGSGMNTFVYTTTTFNGNLYAGGYSSTGDTNILEKWNGTIWSTLGNGLNFTSVNALAAYNGNLYAGGNDIEEWNGSIWSTLGSGACGGINNGSVFALMIYDGDLSVGGSFVGVGCISANNIAEWSLPAGINEINESSSVNLYPNPNNGELTISFLKAFSNSEVEIYNAVGEKVHETILNTNTTQINLNILATPGVYLYRIISKNRESLATGKFIVQ